MEKQTVNIKTEFIKLDSLLKYAGLAVTGGQAKQLVETRAITVNGDPVSQRGKKIRPGDKVNVAGKVIEVGREVP